MTSNELRIRPGSAEDAEACGAICHDAFAEIAAAHNFDKDFPSQEAAIGALSGMLASPSYSVVAEANGRVLGSNFLNGGPSIYGVGPITVNPSAQNSGAGRMLMQAVLDQADEVEQPA